MSIVQSSVDWTFFRWFVYKQIIFTENRSTWNATNRTSSALYPAGTLASIHWPYQMDISSLYRETSLFFSPWIHLEKHFDQLNSKCECHWIWHRWMISVESKWIRRVPRKKTIFEGKNHILGFFFSSVNSSIVLTRCIDESERIVCLIGAVETRWWQKKILHDLELSRCLSCF